MHNAASQLPKPARPSSFQASPVKYIDVGHSRIAYRVMGSGPDLLFIHGWPLDSATFRAIAPALASHFRCHLFDLPGAGATEITPSSPLDLESHPATVRSLIAALGLERYAIVSHDSGGYIARAIAAEDPRVVALVLGNTEVPGHMPRVVRDIRALLSLPFGSSVLRNALGVRALRRYAFSECFADPSYVDGEFYGLFVAPLLDSATRAEAAFELIRRVNLPMLEELPAMHRKIQGEVLLVWGERDRIFPLRRAREIVPQFARARLEVIRDGKCFVHDEQPAKFTALALPFLRDAFTRAPAAQATA